MWDTSQSWSFLVPFSRCKITTEQVWILTSNLGQEGPALTALLTTMCHPRWKKSQHPQFNYNLTKANFASKQDKHHRSTSFPFFPFPQLCPSFPAFLLHGQNVLVHVGMSPRWQSPSTTLLAVCRSQETIHSTLNDLCNFLGLAPGLGGFSAFSITA